MNRTVAEKLAHFARHDATRDARRNGSLFAYVDRAADRARVTDKEHEARAVIEAAKATMARGRMPRNFGRGV